MDRLNTHFYYLNIETITTNIILHNELYKYFYFMAK